MPNAARSRTGPAPPPETTDAETGSARAAAHFVHTVLNYGIADQARTDPIRHARRWMTQRLYHTWQNNPDMAVTDADWTTLRRQKLQHVATVDHSNAAVAHKHTATVIVAYRAASLPARPGRQPASPVPVHTSQQQAMIHLTHTGGRWRVSGAQFEPGTGMP